MNVYESWAGDGQRIIVDRQNGDPLIVIPDRGDVVCTAAWHLPESAECINDEEGFRTKVLTEVDEALKKLKLPPRAQSEVRDVLESLGYAG